MLGKKKVKREGIQTENACEVLLCDERMQLSHERLGKAILITNTHFEHKRECMKGELSTSLIFKAACSGAAITPRSVSTHLA